MFDVVCPAFLDRYARWIQQLNDENPDAWGLVYQAEVRARLEHAPDVRERLEERYAEDVVNNRPTTFDPKRPWNSVWRALIVEEKDYWYKAVEKPGLLMMAGAAKQGQFIGDDAPAKRPVGPGDGGGSEHKRHKTDGAIVPYVPTPPNPHGGAGRGKGAGGKKSEDLSVHDGSKYLKNRFFCLWRGYQDGTCLRQNSWNLCAVDGASAHQCELCLMTGHGSSEAAKCPKQRGKGGGRANKGRGAGRGGAGRGRGRGRW